MTTSGNGRDGGTLHNMEGGLKVHDVDLRQSLPKVLRAIETKF
jgi:hypothetical protein